MIIPGTTLPKKWIISSVSDVQPVWVWEPWRRQIVTPVLSNAVFSSGIWFTHFTPMYDRQEQGNVVMRPVMCTCVLITDSVNWFIIKLWIWKAQCQNRSWIIWLSGAFLKFILLFCGVNCIWRQLPERFIWKEELWSLAMQGAGYFSCKHTHEHFSLWIVLLIFPWKLISPPFSPSLLQMYIPQIGRNVLTVVHHKNNSDPSVIYI